MMDRWTVERAVRHRLCPLDPPGRQLILTLLTWSDPATATIPERFTPSLTDLVNATGLARSTVAKWLNLLEGKDGDNGEERTKHKWVWRDRPTVADARSKKARTVYRLGVPPDLLRALTELGVVGPRAGPAASGTSDSSGSAGSRGGPVKAGNGSTRGLALVRSSDRVGPPLGRKTYGEQEPVQSAGTGGDDHAYIEGPNGRCALPGCTKSAPLHTRRLNVVSRRERKVIGE
ncbi:hypothetical protein [Micromonospora sp. WMMD1082]|uniref:hypothetical protein n=1 Tax=Micromonospora sp. WMMD1082 TaxID=3016104 RepID=UPI0024161219|nr:hypothetical protein [Micromonospora sp. WMMD1082]MDG4796970.1 hypothetical protein [Micromonospora sp. WMMD1082]